MGTLAKSISAPIRLIIENPRQLVFVRRSRLPRSGSAYRQGSCIGEYVRGGAHTNTIEGYFTIFKRGMMGVYQHCSSHHLKPYLAELDFRYNQRVARWGSMIRARMEAALMGILGKRLTYRDSL